MTALLASPATAFHFSFDLKPAGILQDATLTNRIWNLHSILVNPASKRDEVKSAKERMLTVLKETRRVPLSQMSVPSMTLPPGRGEEKILAMTRL
jgi:hypothetical protein